MSVIRFGEGGVIVELTQTQGLTGMEDVVIISHAFVKGKVGGVPAAGSVGGVLASLHFPTHGQAFRVFEALTSGDGYEH